MRSNVDAVAECPKCESRSVSCRFNFFDRGDLQIHSWEHKCLNCGWRDTKAFRSDDPPEARSAEPAKCPFCAREVRQ